MAAGSMHTVNRKKFYNTEINTMALLHHTAKHLLDSTNMIILAVVSLDVESYSAFINCFIKRNFYTNISILAAVSHDDERTAPSSIFF